jgi:uncharacterized protein YjbJ (UPF0337 family)
VQRFHRRQQDGTRKQSEREIVMGTDDKINNKVQQTTGTVKQHVGSAVGNESMEAEGRKDQAAGNLKQAGEKVKDAFKN